MKIIKKLCFLLALGLVLNMNAQQDPHSTLYRYNLSFINPAVAGTNGGVEGFLGVRDQWAGEQQSPSTQTFNINSPFGDRVGLGLNAMNDDVFIVSEVHLYADFSYRLQIADNTNLYLGLKAGGSFLNIDLGNLGIQNDPLLLGNVSTFNPNVGVGAYMKNEKYYVSLSAPGLLKNDRIDKEGLQPAEASDRIHTFISGGYYFDLSDTWQLKPSTMVRVVSGAPISIDGTLTAEWNRSFEFGVNYRYDESIAGIANFLFQDWAKIGFVYEYTTTDVSNFNNGTIELFVKFLIKNNRNTVPEE